MSMATTRTASRQAGVAPASQYAASPAVRPSTWPSRPLTAGQVIKAGVPPVREKGVLAGLLVAPPPCASAAVLVNAQVSDRFRVLAEDCAGLLPERGVRGRPRDAVAPG